jgi:membrane-associated phospholipid phosphatase
MLNNGLVTWIKEWPTWWRSLTPARKFLPLVLILAYWGALVSLGGLRGDHLNLGITMLALAYAGRIAEPLGRFLFPVFMTGVIYDSQRFYSDYIRGPVHVSEPYSFDKRFFGIATPQGILTPNEWWQLHTHWGLDLITGFAYLIFFALFIVIAAYFLFYISKQGTRKLRAEEIGERGKAPIWSFLWVNLLGYSTYYWYAAAPPWYVAKYGIGPAKMDVAASSAGCARFDQLLGTHFFSEMYGRAADVFGAIPSLHVAYPLLAVFFAFRFGALRVFSVVFYVVMCFSAVYLNHHYLLDIIWGSSYALLCGYLTDLYFIRKSKRGGAIYAGAPARATSAESNAQLKRSAALPAAGAADPAWSQRASGRNGFSPSATRD